MQAKQVLVVGSMGALGKELVNCYVKHQWGVFGADVVSAHSNSHTYHVVGANSSLEQIQDSLLRLVDGRKLDAVINVAGGWAGGSIRSSNTAATTELMLRQSLFTCVACAHVCARLGQEGSLLLFMGAAAAQEPTPNMIGYGLAKAAVHNLCRTIAADSSQLPQDARVVTLLPATLDTPGNRQAMPQADTSTWTPLKDLSEQIVQWSEGLSVPPSGSLVKVQTKHGKTAFGII